MQKCILLLTVLCSFFLGLSAIAEQPSQEEQPLQEEKPLQRAQSALLIMRMKDAWLVQSAAESNVDRAMTLLSLPKINVDFQDGTGRTALHYAAINDLYDLAETLLGMEADTSIEDNEGDTAQTLAQKEHHSKVAKLIGQAIEQAQ